MFLQGDQNVMESVLTVVYTGKWMGLHLDSQYTNFSLTGWVVILTGGYSGTLVAGG